eukprot:4758215-Pyramimonas_sp.AAC.1
MPADCLTKADAAKGNLALNDLLRKGTLALIDEDLHMSERALNEHLKSRTKSASKRAIQKQSEGPGCESL